MPSASVHLFVYGSLKRGGRHHDELEGATFLGLAEAGPGYRLEPLGEYLALVPDERGGVVPGELFEVPLTKLPDLDVFEGDAYVRTEVPVRLAQAKPERHETDRHATDRHQTEAQAKPERHETDRHATDRHATNRHQTEAQAKPERHETDRHETERNETDRGNSAGTRLALAYLRKAR